MNGSQGQTDVEGWEWLLWYVTSHTVTKAVMFLYFRSEVDNFLTWWVALLWYGNESRNNHRCNLSLLYAREELMETRLHSRSRCWFSSNPPLNFFMILCRVLVGEVKVIQLPNLECITVRSLWLTYYRNVKVVSPRVKGCEDSKTLHKTTLFRWFSNYLY